MSTPEEPAAVERKFDQMSVIADHYMVVGRSRPPQVTFSGPPCKSTAEIHRHCPVLETHYKNKNIFLASNSVIAIDDFVF